VPDLDFSDILVDPDLADVFNVKRRVDVVSPTSGLSTTTQTLVNNLVGVVAPEDKGSNTRRDDSQMTSRTITVITKFRLRAASDNVQPDVVVYDGVDFTVKSVQGWHRFGAGFILAVAESMNASDPPFA
jgi:hypothetical protein